MDDEVAVAFELWRSSLETGLLAMRADGVLKAGADTRELSLVLLTALQGGLLLTQVTQDPAPLRASLNAAVHTVREAAAQRSDRR